MHLPMTLNWAGMGSSHTLEKDDCPSSSCPDRKGMRARATAVRSTCRGGIIYIHFPAQKEPQRAVSFFLLSLCNSHFPELRVLSSFTRPPGPYPMPAARSAWWRSWGWWVPADGSRRQQHRLKTTGKTLADQKQQKWLGGDSMYVSCVSAELNETRNMHMG